MVDIEELDQEEEEATAEQAAQDTGSQVEQARRELPPAHRAALEKYGKRAREMGYGFSFDQAEREELPGLAGVIAQKHATKNAKGVARKELLREYPSLRTAADGPESAA